MCVPVVLKLVLLVNICLLFKIYYNQIVILPIFLYSLCYCGIFDNSGIAIFLDFVRAGGNEFQCSTNNNIQSNDDKIG